MIDIIDFSGDDLFYNKDRFNNGEINLCFITGHAGSGKTTLANQMLTENTEHINLDELILISDNYSIDELEEYSPLLYEYFSTVGKKWYKDLTWLNSQQPSFAEYEKRIFPEFVSFAKKYASEHPFQRYIIEGISLFETCSPQQFDNCAFYIKGTPMEVCMRRRKKNIKTQEDIDWYKNSDRQLKEFRDYFQKKIYS